MVGFLSGLGVSSRSHRLFSISLALGLSLGYLSLVGTCWEHHYLTRLAPPTPCSVMELKRMIFFLLRPSSWQELNVGASAGMLQRFCRARDDPPPPSSSSSSSSPFLWNDVIVLVSACHCQGDCVYCEPY